MDLRKLWLVILLGVLLCGCKQTADFETVMDATVTNVPAEKMDVFVNFPEDAANEVMTTEDSGTIYLCDNYTITVQTVPGGNLKSTVQNATGYTPEQLALIETVQGNYKRYCGTWTAVGETGEQVGRCIILDDGNYHYVLTTMADAQIAGKLLQGDWNELLNSFRIVLPEETVNSGS